MAWHRVAGSTIACGCRLHRTRLQPPSPTVAAPLPDGCRCAPRCCRVRTASFATCCAPRHTSTLATWTMPSATWVRPPPSCLTPHHSPLTTHSSLTTHHSLLTPHSSPLTTHSSLLTPHYLPLTTYHLPLTTHYLLLTTHHLLPTTYRRHLTEGAGSRGGQEAATRHGQSLVPP